MKTTNNIFARSFKWAFLILMATIMSNKLYAQEKQNGTKFQGIVVKLGEQKQVLSRQDSVCITSICSPEIYEKIIKLSDVQDSLSDVFSNRISAVNFTKKYVPRSPEKRKKLKNYRKLARETGEIFYNNEKTISNLLKECFNQHVMENAIKVYTDKNSGNIIIKGYSIYFFDTGETTFVSPGMSALAKERIYHCDQHSR